MILRRTRQGHLLIWERCGTRYTLGYRVTRSVRRFDVRRWVIAVRPFSAHFVTCPTESAPSPASTESDGGTG